MGELILSRKDLIEHYRNRNLDDIGHLMFKGSFRKEIIKSDLIIFIDNNRFKIIKSRFKMEKAEEIGKNIINDIILNKRKRILNHLKSIKNF